MADMRGVSALEEELARSKEILKGFDESIKKLTGRDPGENRQGQRRVLATGDNFGGRGRVFAAARRSLGEPGGQSGGPPAKRRAVGGAFSRLGPRLVGRQGRDSGGEEDDPGNKPAVQSSVIATPKESRTRQDMIQAQNKDPEGKARNRRMFGVLLGTLQSFKKDARVKEDKVQQRKAIEEKLELKAVEEREQIKKERQTLFNQRKKEQAKVRRLEQKMELVKIHKEWETQTKYLMNFARTKGKPHIYYKPKMHNSATEKKVKETAKVLEGVIEERRKQLEEEIEELTKKDEESKEEEKGEDEEEEEEDEDGEEGEKFKDAEEEEERVGGEIKKEKDSEDEEQEMGEGKEKEDKGVEEEKENQEGDKVEEVTKVDVKKEHKSTRESEKDSRSKRHSESEKKRDRSSRRDRRDSREKERRRSRDRRHSENDRDRRSSRSERKEHKRRHRSKSPAKTKDSEEKKGKDSQVAQESTREDIPMETNEAEQQAAVVTDSVVEGEGTTENVDSEVPLQGELPTELPPGDGPSEV